MARYRPKRAVLVPMTTIHKIILFGINFKGILKKQESFLSMTTFVWFTIGNSIVVLSQKVLNYRLKLTKWNLKLLLELLIK